MRTRRTRIRRGAPPRRGRSTWTRGRARGRYRPTRGGRPLPADPPPPPQPYRRRPGSRYNSARFLKSAIAVGSVAVVIAVVVAVLAGGGLMRSRETSATRRPTLADSPDSVAGQVVYTARTANDAAIALPAAVQHNLFQAGLAHQSIELIRVGYTGDVSTSYVDMTPRTGDSSTDPPLRIHGRAVPGHRREDLRHPGGYQLRGGRPPGGRALFAGLIRATFTGAPVIIISSGLDLANPDNFRNLDWSVPAR